MSRSGYGDDTDDWWAVIRYRGAVESAIRGKRGQAFLRDLLRVLESMPDKKLIACELQSECGVCALGAVAIDRELDVWDVDPEDAERVAEIFGIAPAMAREIVDWNDSVSYFDIETEDQQRRRHAHMVRWVRSNIRWPSENKAIAMVPPK